MDLKVPINIYYSNAQMLIFVKKRMTVLWAKASLMEHFKEVFMIKSWAAVKELCRRNYISNITSETIDAWDGIYREEYLTTRRKGDGYVLFRVMRPGGDRPTRMWAYDPKTDSFPYSVAHSDIEPIVSREVVEGKIAAWNAQYPKAYRSFVQVVGKRRGVPAASLEARPA